MELVQLNALVAAVMFFGILGMIAIGRVVVRRRAAAAGDAVGSTRSSVDTAVYALLGLLIAFTFSGAAERFAARRALIIEEANAIGTAYYRIDLLPEAVQPEMRQRFRSYLDTRLEAYASMPDIEAGKAGLARAAALQDEIWAAAKVASAPPAPAQCAMLLLPALNAMFDIASARYAAIDTHPPALIFVLLIVLAQVSGLLLGLSQTAAHNRDGLHGIIYAGVLTVIVFVILDIEYPRQGLIRVDQSDQLLHAVRASMK